MVTSPTSDSLVFKDVMLTDTCLAEEDAAFPVPVFTYTPYNPSIYLHTMQSQYLPTHHAIPVFTYTPCNPSIYLHTMQSQYLPTHHAIPVFTYTPCNPSIYLHTMQSQYLPTHHAIPVFTNAPCNPSIYLHTMQSQYLPTHHAIPVFTYTPCNPSIDLHTIPVFTCNHHMYNPSIYLHTMQSQYLPIHHAIPVLTYTPCNSSIYQRTMQSYHVQVDIAFPCAYVCTVAMEAVSEEESGDKYLPPNLAEYSDHYYSTNAPHPDLVRACEDDDVEQVRHTVNIGTTTEPVTRPDLSEQVPKSYFYDPFRKRIPMTIMVSQKYLLPPLK